MTVSNNLPLFIEIKKPMHSIGKEDNIKVSVQLPKNDIVQIKMDYIC